jgi:hypothetical protein
MRIVRIALNLTILVSCSACSSGPNPIGGGGGAAGNGGSASDAGSKVACASTNSCAPSEYCTTEDGVCNLPPGCTPALACPAVCYGVCEPRKGVAYDCNVSSVACDRLPPECPPGQTASASDGSCYGPCVPIEQCKCSPDVPADCPEDYVCWRFAGHCGPYVR